MWVNISIKKISFLALAVNLSFAMADTNQKRDEFLRNTQAYNPIKTKLDAYVAKYIESASTRTELLKQSLLPIAAGTSFDALLDVFSRSFSTRVSKTQKMTFVWNGEASSGGDFGVIDQKTNSIRAVTKSELAHSVKRVTISPVFDESLFNPNSFEGLRYISISIKVGLEYGGYWNSKLGSLGVDLKFVEHPRTKEIIVVVSDLDCSNCEASILESFAITEDAIVAEIYKSSRLPDEKGDAESMYSSKEKIVVSLNDTLNFRNYTTGIVRTSQSIDKPYFQSFYSTGGRPVASEQK